MSQAEEMDKVFRTNLPESLYMSHYELREQFGFTAEQWRIYQRDNAQFITTEMAALAEPAARRALAKLGNSSVSSQEVSAIKELLAKSKLINEAQHQQERVIVMFVPPCTPEPERKYREVKEYDPSERFDNSGEFDLEF